MQGNDVCEDSPPHSAMSAMGSKPGSMGSETIIKRLGSDSFDQPPYAKYSEIITVLFLSFLSLAIFSLLRATFFEVRAPYVGHRSYFEPAWLVGLRFVRGSGPMIKDGYRKYKSQMFKIRRNDSDILVISNKHVEQLRSLPDQQISAIGAHIKNLLGRYSTTEIMLESDLPRRVLQQKLTPNLASIIPIVKDELDFSLGAELERGANMAVPGFRQVGGSTDLRHSASNRRARLGTGLHGAAHLPQRGMARRQHPLHRKRFHDGPILPSYWRILSNLSVAKRIIEPIVRERRAAAANSGGGSEKKANDLLQWMMDVANDNEGQPHKLAHRQLLLSLASIHTTTSKLARRRSLGGLPDLLTVLSVSSGRRTRTL
ncbi:hypothetical protein O1611_g7693 [Lasiodiplodia mahajangana]|uniref:Uncharacterized protein n=1 Tax=Lasiodiplodia mahajangana TaxID=1108764 RepID=A0ACC2JEQ0_9PEZI|nr:hypothetical protein O1611_g7693 [Lasiodiplodia mahajangana]